MHAGLHCVLRRPHDVGDLLDRFFAIVHEIDNLPVLLRHLRHAGAQLRTEIRIKRGLLGRVRGILDQFHGGLVDLCIAAAVPLQRRQGFEAQFGHGRDLGAAKQRLACCSQYGIPATRSAPGQPQKNCTGEGAPTGNLQVSFVRPSSVQAVARVGSTILLTGLGGGAWPSVICSIMFARRGGGVTLPLP